MKDFFDAPYKLKPCHAEVGVKIGPIGFNDRSTYKLKKYVNGKFKLDFILMHGDRRTWSEIAIDIVADFTRDNDIYQNRVRIVETELHSTGGTVYVQCYMLESLLNHIKRY